MAGTREDRTPVEQGTSGSASALCALSYADTTLTIVMPAYNAAHLLPVTLPAALAAAGGSEVIVVDPGSTDDTAAVAEALGARVIRLGHRAGPAEARNRGVEAVESDVVLFVDSDCRAHPDVGRRIRRAFTEDPELVSLTGSYDSDPPHPGFFSQYMNLRHHQTHQRAVRDGAGFWAGCGAVRVSAFREVGGFDAKRYPRPMIEDIELGIRMKALGRTRLDPDLQVTHLKRWTAVSVVMTDVLCRAIPWTKVILEGSGIPNDLNLRRSQRFAALLSPIAILAVVLLPLCWKFPAAWTLLGLGVVAGSVALNFDLVRIFARRRGVVFAAGGWLFHQVHLFYSAATFATLKALSLLAPRRVGPPLPEPSAAS